MGIGTSMGAYYDDEFHHAAARWDDKYDDNVITPNTMYTDRALDQAELDPTTGLGIEVSSPEVDWSKMNQPLGTLKGTAPEDTPTAFKTPNLNITEGDIDRAIDVGMGAGPGTMAGAGSRTAKAASNWFKGADGHLRYEIDDSVAKYTAPKMSESGPLSRFLDHPELFKAYPELKNTKVFNDPYYSNKGASFDTEMNKITLGSAAAEDKSILLHEIQHAIQGLEGFAKGGNPGRNGKDFNLKYESAVNDLRSEFLDLQKKESKGNLDSKEQPRLDELKEIFKKYSEYARGAEDKARENYLSLAGEVEARNVQTRANLTAEERLKYSPQSTEDTARSKQIVRDKPSKTTPYQDPVDGFLSY